MNNGIKKKGVLIVDDKNCLKCGHFRKPPKGEGPSDGGYCLYLPPVTHMVQLVHPMSGEISYNGRSMFPIVSVEMMCSRFIEKKPEILDS